MIQKFNNYWNNNYKIFGLLVSILCAFNYYLNLISRIYVIHIVGTYLTIDTIHCLLNKEYIYILHHYAGISLIYFSLVYDFYNSKYSNIFINMENSNIFYNLLLFTNGRLKIYISILFYITFFYFRIYKFYYCLFQKEYYDFYLSLYQVNNLHAIIFLYIPIFIIANLNLYWFYLMTKKFIKKIKKL